MKNTNYIKYTGMGSSINNYKFGGQRKTKDAQQQMRAQQKKQLRVQNRT